MKILNTSYLGAIIEIIKNNPPDECISGKRAADLQTEGYQRIMDQTCSIDSCDPSAFFSSSSKKETDSILRTGSLLGSYAIIIEDQYQGDEQLLSFTCAWAMDESIYDQLMKHL